MTPPEAPDTDPGMQPPAAFACSDHPRIATLCKRADFLTAARARRQGTPAVMVQARFRNDGTTLIRVGITCSKKVGNAVARNRSKRRLRALARAVLPSHAKPGWDYVLIGRRDDTAKRPFDRFQSDLIHALGKLHR